VDGGPLCECRRSGGLPRCLHDSLRELNTDCVGVADGGLCATPTRSWPVSYLAIWPTGWFQRTHTGINSRNDTGNGDVDEPAFPEVCTDSGFDDSYDGITRMIDTAGRYAGDLSIDVVSLQEISEGVELAINGSSADGHSQVASGDHGASLLSNVARRNLGAATSRGPSAPRRTAAPLAAAAQR